MISHVGCRWTVKPVVDVRFRKGNRIVSTPVVAQTTNEARLIAARTGTFLGEVKKRKESSRGGMSAAERYVFLYQLATMNTAKVPLSVALNTLREHHGGRLGRAAAGDRKSTRLNSSH